MGNRLTAWALDLDGVVWRGSETIEGAPEAIERLREAGRQVAFVTNSAYRTPAEVADKLAAHGIPDAEAEVVTSAMAAATMVQPSDRVMAIGTEGLRAALAARGAELVDGGVVDAVVLGITFDFDYAMLARAMEAIHQGARFIATNTDPTYPVADGLLPGNGALVAALATAGGVQPEVAGKPHAPIAEIVRTQLGSGGIMVGDRPDTDGLFAQTIGYRFGLVLSGVTSDADLPVSPAPDLVAGDLLALVKRELGSS